MFGLSDNNNLFKLQSCDAVETETYNIDNILEFDFTGFKNKSFMTKKKSLDDFLIESEKNKNKELKLCDIIVKSFPEKIKNFIWVEKLILESNGISTLNSLGMVFPNLKHLEIKNNKIVFLDGDLLPSTLETFIFTENETIRISGLKEGITHLNLYKNNFRIIDSAIPETVVELNLSNNKFLHTLPIFQNNQNLTYLDISNTNISNINALPNSIIKLNVCCCRISKISKFPTNLIEFLGYRSTITEITGQFPLNLKKFDAFNNFLTVLPDFPDSIESIDISHNIMEKIPKFPQTLKCIDMRENKKLLIFEIKELVSQFPNTTIIYNEQSYYGIDNNDTDNKDNNNDIYYPFKDNSSRMNFNLHGNNSHGNMNYGNRNNGNSWHGNRNNRNSWHGNGNNENNWHGNGNSGYNFSQNKKKKISFNGDFNISNANYIVHTSLYDV
jgi:hypothetical protein